MRQLLLISYVKQIQVVFFKKILRITFRCSSMDDVKASKCYVSGTCMQCKVGEESKFWNRCNQVPHLTQDTIRESNKYTKTLDTGEPRSQPFPSR